MGVISPPVLSRQRLGRWARAAATYDVFPEFSARVRRLLYNPFGVLLLAALAALLCGLFLHPQGFVLLGGVAAVLALGVTWPWLSLRGLAGALAYARPRAVEGEPVGVALTVRNRMPWSAWGVAVRDGSSGEPAVSLAAAPGRRAFDCAWTFHPPRRGVYPLVSPQITTGFPFGLWDNRRPLGVAAPLVVWPRTYPVGPVPPVGGEHQVEGTVSRSQVGSNGDVLGVRPYRRGDSPRRIHWAQSARHDRLIVCELQAATRPVIQLVLDADPRVHAGAGADSSREWAVRIVASFARGWLEAGAQVGVAWGGGALPVSAGPTQIHKVLDALARLPDGPCPALPEALAGPACRGFRDGLQLVVTTDRSLDALPGAPPQEEYRRWVVLHAAAFDGGGAAAPPPGRIQPWLWVDAPARAPALLRRGWKEARHGS